MQTSDAHLQILEELTSIHKIQLKALESLIGLVGTINSVYPAIHAQRTAIYELEEIVEKVRTAK